MDKTTAGKLLAIRNHYLGKCPLTTGADDRVAVYLAAVEMRDRLRGWCVDVLRGEGEDVVDQLDAVREWIGHAYELASLLAEVEAQGVEV